MFEDNNIEFKREYAQDIKKEVLAFANTNSGVIYIGKDNEGTLTGGDKYETVRSLVQDLTFHETSEEFNNRGIEFGESQKKTLGIIGLDGLYTNLGLLLSD